MDFQSFARRLYDHDPDLHMIEKGWLDRLAA